MAVRATTRAGAEQCFRGSYTLRRSVVDGATAEQRSWRIAGRYRARGDVVYVTSVEVVSGGAAERQQVVIEVVRDGGGWRIESYEVR